VSHHDDLSAHEQSRESVLRAAREGMTSVEIDLRVTLDGVVGQSPMNDHR
jgi:glycerophosphoryl diester phosphodiesterase